MSQRMIENDEIDSDLYPKYNVKRGLRNANGTGVVVGLTRISEVIGYETDENKNKIPVEGQLYYRGYEIRDLVESYINEDRFGFEEVTYLLLFGDLPTQKQLNEFKKLIGEKRPTRRLCPGYDSHRTFQEHYEQAFQKCLPFIAMMKIPMILRYPMCCDSPSI